MIDLRYLKKLIDMIDASSVDSVEITSDKGFKIRIAKSPVQRGMPMTASMPVPTVLAGPIAEPRSTPAAGIPMQPFEAATPSELAARATPLLEVKSPMVGTYYQSPEPAAKAYVAVGDRVQKGMTLCIIEA